MFLLKLCLLKIARFCLFLLKPEASHNVAIKLLRLNLVPSLIKTTQAELSDKQNLLSNPLAYIKKYPIGLAAGFDKNADCIKNLAKLGFDYLELGTCTPLPQSGNPKPRLFRLLKQNSIINRFGFNSKGADYFVANLQKAMQIKNRPLIGANIGKNKDSTSITDDYLLMMQKVYPCCDYITINISSPNTKGLRDIQQEQALETLLESVSQQSTRLSMMHGFTRPIFLKIAPDITKEQIIYISALCIKYKIDAIIAANTTIRRDFAPLQNSKHKNFTSQQGGLSGALLNEQSLNILCLFTKELKGKLPIISSGGIFTKEQFKQRLDCGAIGVQIYSAFIFKGPELIAKLKS